MENLDVARTRVGGDIAGGPLDAHVAGSGVSLDVARDIGGGDVTGAGVHRERPDEPGHDDVTRRRVEGEVTHQLGLLQNPVWQTSFAQDVAINAAILQAWNALQ